MPRSRAQSDEAGAHAGTTTASGGTISGAPGDAAQLAFLDQVDEPALSGQDDTRPDDRAATDGDALVESAAATHEGAILDDDRPGAGRFQHAPHLDRGREMDVATDLGAGTHEDV